MKNKILAEIISTCISLEKAAESVYDEMSEAAESSGLSDFWSSMARQERGHISYWKELLNLAQEGKLKNVFDRPDAVLQELKDIEAEVDSLLNKKEIPSEVASSFLLAYKLEFMVMHPAFSAMFILMQKETKKTSPVHAYDTHISGLISRMKEYEADSPEYELISSLLEKLWERNRDLAEQLAEIKSLRGLLPICMHCKKIREDDGYWSRMEKYVEERADVRFSQGI